MLAWCLAVVPAHALAQETAPEQDSAQTPAPEPSPPADPQPSPESASTASPAPDSAANSENANSPSANPEEQPATIPVKELRADQGPTKRESKDVDQSSGVTLLDTIEVTADKRLKSQRDIPGSVGAIRGDELEKMHAQGMKDYLKLIPGVTYVDQGNEESLPIIRGITTSLGLGATAATTGVYLDDMPFADLFTPLSIPDLNPFDLDRVEVLKGPQGTLFGSGALAGAVRYIVHRPDHSLWEGKVSETVSATPDSGGLSPVTAGAINIPLFGDAVAVRAVGLYRKDSGLYDMSAQDSNGNSLRNDKDADKLKQASWRFLMSWNPIDDLKLSGFYFGQKTHQEDVGFADQVNRPQSSKFPFPSPRNHDFGGGNLLATYDLGWAQLLSSSNRMTKDNYIDQHQEFGLSLGEQNQNEFFSIVGAKTRGFTQEFRLASPEGGTGNWEWLAGASYLNYKNARWEFAYIGPNIPDPTRPDQVTDLQKAQGQVFATIDQVGTEKALFGEVTGRLGEHWEATIGARKYETGLLADTVLCGAQVIVLFQEMCIPQHFTDVAKGLNPKLSVRYLHNRNVQWYVLVAKGFQFGGIQVNPPAPGFPQSAQDAGFSFGPYKSSSLWNYESGIRTEWLDRRLRFDLTFFYLDWKDLQLTIAVPYLNTNAKFALIANVGRAHSEGIEMALDVIPFTGAHWTSSAAWITAVTDVPVSSPGGTPIPSGTRLPGTPKFQWSNVVSYAHSLPYFTSWDIGPVLTHSFIGQSPDALQPTGTVGGYNTLDARIALTKPSSRFLPEISLGVNNLTDVRGAAFHTGGTNVTDGQPFNFYHFVPPRTTVLSLSMKY